MASKNLRTVTITLPNGDQKEYSTSFAFYSVYESANFPGEYIVKFHRTANAAMKGSWDSPEMKRTWKHVNSGAL